MAYFLCQKGSSGGDLPSEFNLYPFPLLLNNFKSNGDSFPIIFDYSQSPASLRQITDLKRCEIKGRIIGYSDYSSSALQQIDMYCWIFARADNNDIYAYDFSTQSWTNKIYSNNSYKADSGNNNLVFGNARVNSHQSYARIVTASKSVVPKNNQLYVDADYTIDFEDIISKANTLGLHFDIEDVSNMISGFGAFSTFTKLPIKNFIICYGYMVGRASSYDNYVRFSVDKTATSANGAYDTKAILEANPPQIKLVF